MSTTMMRSDLELFKFCGQTRIETWKLRGMFLSKGWSKYNNWLVDELPFCFQKIKDLADNFPFWQRKKKTGRPPTSERELLIAFLLRQYFDTTFRITIGMMKLLNWFFEFEKIPDYSILSRKNQSKRWLRLWKRFFKYVLKDIRRKKVVVATDASGYSGRKKHWNDEKHNVKCIQDWVKLHASIEVDSLLILSYSLSGSDVHESQMFEEVWDDIPDNFETVRSLADGGYGGNPCLEIVRRSGSIPIHGIRKDAVLVNHPHTAYEKMVSFAKHFPNRYAELYSKRNQVETTFSMIDKRFGYRIKCRDPIARENEVQAKVNAYNIKVITAQEVITSN